MRHDPVCGRKMNRNKAYAIVEHRGQEYLLCCPLCQSEFEKDPDKYLVQSKRKNKVLR
ncbi:YHS domain-containing protein [candidate division KSB1 bacterium]|nr:YHS domain-containing protein [candidate division KSB1 bacterium]NIR71074.1 YHS domain-containing protein [candidate division KSB1 bacterium]NIS27884.1 YHS domain-containing protein [candidate division KSB1 bacterium]NIT74767.1 YHS domain-containing protein [candidate division KSB1 bacterium]NIU28544.1 YHS domain-containing protein [candidate division KSB1 bacterium]